MGYFSEERLSHLAHLIQDGLLKEPLVGCPEKEKVLKEIKRGLEETLKVDDEIDEMARQKISSQKRGIFEGSPEWEILYRKYFEEELNKRHL
ncbi:MAG: DUF507 family protein [bacterium]|nr:DUF507 family protein [bacterium]